MADTIVTATTTSTPISDQLARTLKAESTGTSELADSDDASWARAVAEDFVMLKSLKQDWDGYGAGPIRTDVINFTTELLARIMRPNTPAPQLTPMSHQGILIEWHKQGIDLEIEIEAPSQVWVSYTIDRQERDWPVKSDFRSLADPIDELTRRRTLAR